MFKKSAVVILLFSICVHLCSSVVSADEIKYEEGVAYLSLLQENLTSKKGVVSESFSQPSNITVINRKDIEKLNASSVVDVLRFQQGVFGGDFIGSGKVNIDIRGFGETGASNVLVLVNGRRTNNIDMANVDWSQIPLDAVEKIEIIRGPSAVLYGDNATGGVINIITRKGIGPTKINVGAEAGSFYSTKIKIGVSGDKDRTSYNVIASRNSTDGFRENSGITNTDINAYIVYDLPKVKTSVDIGYHMDNFGMPGSVSETDWNNNKLTKASTPNNSAKTGDSYIQMAFETPIANNLKNEFTLSSRNRLSNSYWRSWALGEERKTDIIGVGNKVCFENPKLGSVIAGLEIYLSKQSIRNLDNNDIPTPDLTEVKKDSLALYVNDDIKLLSEKLYLTAGARWELGNYSFASTGSDEVTISSAVQSYSAGVSYLFNDKTSVYAKWSSAFRLPKVDEYYSVWSGLNAGLQNQSTQMTECGLKKIFNKNVSGNISLFQADTENEIYLNPATIVNENYKKTQRLGAELGVTVEPLKNLAINANYTYTDAKITEGEYKNSVVPAVPAHLLSLVNTLKLSNFNINLSGNYVGERYFISDQKNVSPKMPAHVRADVKASYSHDGVKIFAGVNNILDTKYAEYGVANLAGTSRVYYPSPLRNFFVGVEVNF